MHMTKISAANIDALAAIVEAARKTGEISTKALENMAATVAREDQMTAMVAYLKSKDALPIEKARAAKLLKTPTQKNRDALKALIEPYKRGDLPQMIEAVKGLPLSQVERRAIENADDDARGMVALPHFQLSKIIEEHGVKITLKTVRLDKPKPQYQSDRVSLAAFFPA